MESLDLKNEATGNTALLDPPAPEVRATPALAVDETVGYDQEEPHSNLIAIYGILGCLVLLFVIMGLQSYFETTKERQIYVQVLAKDSAELNNVRVREEGQLRSYKVLDRDKGIVQLPIDRAMELIVQEANAAN